MAIDILLLGKGGLMGNVVRLAPPLSLKKDQVHELLEIIDTSLAQVAKEFHP